MKYRIWSFEHNQWWNPKSNGYTNDINHAGKYSLYEANYICINANKFADNIMGINESMIPVEGEDG